MPPKVLLDGTEIPFEDTWEASDKGQFVKDLTFQIDFDRATAGITSTDTIVVSMRINKHSFKEIAKELGIHKGRIIQKWQELRPNLDKFFESYPEKEVL